MSARALHQSVSVSAAVLAKMNGESYGGSNLCCVCPPKTLEFGDSDGDVHRADHLETLHRVLAPLDFGGRQKLYTYLPGGGMVADQSVDMSAFETCMTAFLG